MSTPKERTSAINAKTQFIERNWRTLAYRSIGTGKPIVLCTRFPPKYERLGPRLPRRVSEQRLSCHHLRLQRPRTFDWREKLRSGLAGSGRGPPEGPTPCLKP